MKTIKIDFKNFWEGFDKEDNFFTNLLRENYKVIIMDKSDDSLDYMFYSIYPEQNSIPKNISGMGDLLRKFSSRAYVFARSTYIRLLNKKKEVVVPEGDFVKILYTTEDVRPDMDTCDFAFSPFSDIDNSRHFEMPLHLVGDYYFDEKLKLPFKRNIDFNKIKKDKTKFCNFIYSQEIPFRNNFFKELRKYKPIDSPGMCMNNMKPITGGSPRDSRGSSKWAIEKLKFLNQYKFTIACENTDDHPYTTEKLVHPFLVNSIPIYLGNKNVSRDFNTKSFINYSDFENMEEFIEHIKKVDSDDNLYRQYLEEPIFNTKEQYDFIGKERVADKLKEIIEGKK